VAYRGWISGLAGAVALTIGLFVLRFPVFLDAYDQWGWQIKCGSGFAADMSQAQLAAADGTDFVDACESALFIRRLWAVPPVVIGALAVVAVLVRATLAPESRPLLTESESA
jgi:H+/Cl- antiporter ClcA